MFFLINSWDLKNRTFSDGDVKLSDWTSFSDETFIQLYGWGVLVMGRLVMERFPLKTRNYWNISRNSKALGIKISPSGPECCILSCLDAWLREGVGRDLTLPLGQAVHNARLAREGVQDQRHNVLQHRLALQHITQYGTIKTVGNKLKKLPHNVITTR